MIEDHNVLGEVQSAIPVQFLAMLWNPTDPAAESNGMLFALIRQTIKIFNVNLLILTPTCAVKKHRKFRMLSCLRECKIAFEYCIR
jgi:hypothetical protein